MPKRRTSTNRSVWPSSSSIRTRVCFGSSSVSSMLPVIRRCITRWTSSSNDITRYLPRRPSRSITRPLSASAIASGGAGLAPARVEHADPLEPAALDGGRQLAADRLYLGELGHIVKGSDPLTI